MDKQIYAGEWKLMEALWAQSPLTLTQLVRALAPETGWAKSTVATMVTRMEAKGLLRLEDGGKARLIYPAVSREDAGAAETQSLLDKLYNGSVGLMMTALVEQNKLTPRELDELYGILRKAEEERDA